MAPLLAPAGPPHTAVPAPGPPGCPVPLAPLVPLPISGRPNNVVVGALIVFMTGCSARPSSTCNAPTGLASAPEASANAPSRVAGQADSCAAAAETPP
jgi:hypothetical protein